ncbi:MAG: alpha-methylacyl-CoA racemase [Solirubrobacteraceae bacterium]|nr:alpha-methylacyl-CoA racemase [Solirubrobacteraceae bacterium]
MRQQRRLTFRSRNAYEPRRPGHYHKRQRDAPGGKKVTAQALAGVRVLDLSRLLSGGFCSLLLADHGADVVKVEDTGVGDYLRWAPPYLEGAHDSAKSALFLALNRNKRSIRVDLKLEAGREVLLALVRHSDVVLESFRPGVLDRLGVGYEAMRAVNPQIVYCAISGYGQDGPLRDRAGHDMNYLGLTGLLGLSGERDGPPVQAAGQIADLGGGALMAAFGILAALRECDRSGEGQLVDISMTDGALSWLAMVAARHFADGEVPGRGGLDLAGGLICYRPYRCADGGWVTLAALEPKFWAAWCRGVGREDLVAEQFSASGGDAHGEVERIFASRTRARWEQFASEVECCLEPVLELDEALDSELVRAREMVVGIDQPGVGQPVRLLGAPVKLSRTPADTNRLPGPALGEHTEALLREAGYADEQIDTLMRSGVVAGPAAGSAGSFLS